MFLEKKTGSSWNLEKTDISFYLITILEFFFVLLQSKKRFKDNSPFLIIFVSLLTISYFLLQLSTFYLEDPQWNSFTGKQVNFIWTFFIPYRTFLPLPPNLITSTWNRTTQFTQNELKSLIKFLILFCFDVYLYSFLLLIMIKYPNLVWNLACVSLTLVIIAIYISKSIIPLHSKKQIRQYLPQVMKVSSLLIPILFIVLESNFQPILPLLHCYLSQISIFIHIWIIRVACFFDKETYQRREEDLVQEREVEEDFQFRNDSN